jgi:hypothetical protein
MIMLTRLWDKDKLDWLDTDVLIVAIDLTEATLDTVEDFVRQGQDKEVSLSKTTSDKSYRQEICGLEEIRKGNFSVLCIVHDDFRQVIQTRDLRPR